MNSNSTIPAYSKANSPRSSGQIIHDILYVEERKDIMSEIINKFANVTVTREATFAGIKTQIVKLSPSKVRALRAAHQELANKQDDGSMSTADMEDAGLKLVYLSCRLGCPDMAELSDEDFDLLPLDDLREFSDNIVEFSGMSPKSNEEGK